MFRTLILLAMIIPLETLAQYFLEKKVREKDAIYLILGIVAYGAVAYVYYLMLLAGNKLALANALFNAGTSVSVTVIGWLLFKQTLTTKQLIGLVITIIGIVLIN